MPATGYDHLWEMVALFFLLLNWIFSVTFFLKTESIPVDGGRISFFYRVGIASFVFALIAISAYYPKWVNMPVNLKPECMTAQYALMSKMVRFLNIDISIMMLVITLQSGAFLMSWSGKPFEVLQVACLVIMFALLIFYQIALWRLGKRFDYFK